MLTSLIFISVLPLFLIFNTRFLWTYVILALNFSIINLLINTPFFPISISILNRVFSIDFLRLPLVFLTIWISSLIILARIKIQNTKKAHKIFVLLILILNSALIFTFSITNILLFYISFEFTLLPTLFLILGWGYQPERIQARFYLILYTVIASLPLLISISLIFTENLSLSFINYFWLTPTLQPLLTLWWISTILAFLVKIPIYTTHLWLPKAHVEAPIAGSIILAGLLLKLGGYGLLRFSSLYPSLNSKIIPPIIGLVIWGAIITRLICLRQSDIKSLIAYSSIGHIGLLTAGTFTNQAWGWEGSLLIIIAHGLSSSALFALANMLYETTKTRNLFLSKGMLHLFPFIAFLWFLPSIANIAAPPTLNLTSESILISSILSSSIWTRPILAASVFLAGAYSLFLYSSINHGNPSNFNAPLILFSSPNFLTIFIHLIPLFFIIGKLDFVINWSLFWSYSWINNIKLQT